MTLRSAFAAAVLALTTIVLPPAEGHAGDAGRWRRLELPGRRWFHAAAYDPAGQRMLMFGGNSPGDALTDVWQLTLTPAYRWSRLEPSNAGPSARDGYSYAFDSARQRLLLFGGRDGTTAYDEVWTLSLTNPPTWTRLTPTGTPGGRFWSTATYDPVRDRLLVHGGRAGSTHFADLWALSLGDSPAWTLLSPGGTPPAARSAHGAAYDPVRDRLVLFGGGNATNVFGDLWALPLGGSSAWAPLAGSGGAPAPSRFRSVTYDPAGDRLVLFGGFDGTYLNEAHSYSFGSATWTALTPGGPLPQGRIGHSAVHDPLHSTLLVFGGGDEAAFEWFDDLWALSLGVSPEWSQPVGNGPSPEPRVNHASIYDPVRQRVLVFGGQGSSGLLGDLWELPMNEEPVWRPVYTQGIGPGPRHGHTAIYDEEFDRLIVFGGETAVGRTQDSWELPLAGPPVWSLLSPAGTPPAARSEHAASYDRVHQRMVVTGGRAAFSYLDDSWELSLGLTPTWTPVTAGMPECLTPFAYHSMVRDQPRDQFITFGGDNYGLPSCTQTWALHAGMQSWWAEIVASGPAWRFDHTALFEPTWDRMVVFGGGHNSSGPGDPSRQYGDVWELLPGVPQWNALSPLEYLPADPRPDSLQGHTAVLDSHRHRMIVFGGMRGISSPTLLDETWALEWAPGTAAVAPGRPDGGNTLRLSIGPNPVGRDAVVRFRIPAPSLVRVTVHDVAGRLVRTLAHDRLAPAGLQEWRWDGHDRDGAVARSGVYLIRVQAGMEDASGRFVLVR